MRVIIHVDMDAFYASIEQRDNPTLKGKPVIIGSPPDRRGVVSAASYEARVFGVHSAMPSRTAGKLCPTGIFLPVRMQRYMEISEQLHLIFEQFTPVFEPISLDEAFLDVTGIMHKWKDERVLACALKTAIFDELRLTSSVGVAANKFLAKLASDLDKPDGLCEVPKGDEEIRRFLAPLPVRTIWGVGKVTGKRLLNHRISTIGDIQSRSLPELQRTLGSRTSGIHLWNLAFGIDDRPVAPDCEEKSISREHTFPEDCGSMEIIRQLLLELSEQVGRRLRKSGRYAGCVSIKLRYSDFRTHTRQESMRIPTDCDRDLLLHALGLLEEQKIKQPVRLIGFGVNRLVDSPFHENDQQELFEDTSRPAAQRERNERLDRAVDALREQYGRHAIRRGNWTLSKSKDGKHPP